MAAGDELEFVGVAAHRDPPPPDRPPRLTAIVGLVIVLVAGLAALTVAAPSTAPVAVVAPSSTLTTSTITTTTTTAAAALRAETELEVGEIAGAGPLLGSPSGLEMWVGGDSPVTRIDLDTGNALTLDYRAFPLLHTGVHLVLFDPARDVFIVIDRTDPTAAPTRLSVDDSFVVDTVAPGPAPSTLWLADRTVADRVAWRLLSLDTLTPVRSASSESIITSRLPYRIEVAIPPVIDARGEELFVLRALDYEYWLDGRLVVHDGERALVETCESVGSCRSAWYAIFSGEELPDPVPSDLLELHELLGPWIHTKTRTGSETLLINSTTGAIVETQQRLRARRFDISPDGRWAAFTGTQRLWMLDLSSGETIELPSVSNRVGSGTSVVLVDRPRPGSP